jgi:hypothetical protein
MEAILSLVSNEAPMALAFRLPQILHRKLRQLDEMVR